MSLAIVLSLDGCDLTAKNLDNLFQSLRQATEQCSDDCVVTRRDCQALVNYAGNFELDSSSDNYKARKDALAKLEAALKQSY